MKCSDLQYGDEVIFRRNMFDTIIFEAGTVTIVNKELKLVGINWLEGYKNRDDFVKYEDCIAVYDESGTFMKFDNISGKSTLLIPE